MMNGEMARYQIADRVREAEAARRASSTRAGRRDATRGTVARVARTAVTLVAWPFRR